MHVDMNCQQICKISRKKTYRREIIPKSFFFWGGATFYWNTLYISYPIHAILHEEDCELFVRIRNRFALKLETVFK